MKLALGTVQFGLPYGVANQSGQVTRDEAGAILTQARASGIDTRGIADHGFINSIYFRDPNGYVIELTARTARHATAMDPATNGAREKLDRWIAGRL